VSESTPTIVPRWEWRTFGTRFEAAERTFAALEPQGEQESDELYLLTESGPNVKIRDELIDVKVLEEVDGDGLQRWMPVLKTGFPVPVTEMAKILQTMGIDAELQRDAYTLDQFLTDVMEPDPSVRAVPVHKRRVRYAVGGAMAELSDVTVDGRSTRTIAVESEDPQAVVAAVDEAWLGDYLNTSYPEGLVAVLDGVPERFAVVDVGTNSVKFHLGERLDDGTWQTVVDRAELTRLGEGLGESGVIAAEPLERTIDAIAGMTEEARSEGALAIAGVGTAGLRIAANGQEVVDRIRARTGLTVEVISGEEESRLAYVAARAGLGFDGGSVVVFDTGGGSSQFTFGRAGEVEERFSVDVGAVRYTERFGLDGEVIPEVLERAMDAISTDLTRIDDRKPPDALVGMGGAVTNLAAVEHGLTRYDPAVVQGTVLDVEQIDRQIERYRTLDAEARRSIVGLQPKRAEVILAGACIVRVITDKLGKSSLTVSDRALRHGVLAERFGGRPEVPSSQSDEPRRQHPSDKAGPMGEK
jgi:exopolyphosphatase / guanosine-5'-triphosphate,3'-diphosphate pyrophosphatase